MLHLGLRWNRAAWRRRAGRVHLSLVLALLAGHAQSQDYGIDPQPAFVLEDPGAAVASAQRLVFSVRSGELETYGARIDYPAAFRFLGFDRIGAAGAVVGQLGVDLDADGVADHGHPLISRGRFSAYLDVLPDGRFAPGLEPELVASSSGALQLHLPYGGDATPATITAPADADLVLDLVSGVMRNPGTPGRYTVSARLTSVDPDTGDANDGVAPGPRRFEAALEVDVLPRIPVLLDEVAIERAVMRAGRAARGSFRVVGRVTFAAGGNGFDPGVDDIEVRFGPYAQQLPAWTLRRAGAGWIYRANDGIRRFRLDDDGGFEVSGWSLDLTGVGRGRPVLFTLAIGDDIGSASIPFGRRSVFP